MCLSFSPLFSLLSDLDNKGASEKEVRNGFYKYLSFFFRFMPLYTSSLFWYEDVSEKNKNKT